MTELLQYDQSTPRDRIDETGDIVPYDVPEETPDFLPADQWVEERADSEHVPILAVSLADRALALEDIMKFYNKRNMTRGSKQQLEIPASDFRRRYDSPEAVQHGAERNTDKLRAGFVRGIRTLAAVDTMQEMGVHDADIDLVYRSVQSELNRNFLDGNATAADRARALKRAQVAARRTQ